VHRDLACVHDDLSCVHDDLSRVHDDPTRARRSRARAPLADVRAPATSEQARHLAPCDNSRHVQDGSRAVTDTTRQFGSPANRYEILAKLATGGMAEIFLARALSSTGVERHVVLKRILRQRAGDVQFVRMFLDEARLAAQLQHANVAQVYDIGRLGDSYFFTMEFVHGETVRGLLARAHAAHQPVPIGCALAIAVGAAAGLHHAHERRGVDGRPLGIVHRDVSPSNLMVSFDGGVKVVDFGVAKASDRMSETRSGTVKGKISYLSPEQCRGVDVDRRSDLFALGIVLWELLATERLYRRSSDFENMTAIVHEVPPPPSSRRAEVPEALDDIVLRMLAKSPADRFQTGAEVIEALESLAHRLAVALSATMLGRLMREVFGDRKEPWVDIDTSTAADGVTVTGEPIPAELALPAEASLEIELGGLPDLSAARVEPDDSPPKPRMSQPKFFSAVTPRVPITVPEAARRPTGQTVAEAGRTQLVVGLASDPGPTTAIAATIAPAPAAPLPVEQTATQPIRRVRTRLLVWLLPAAVVGVLIGVWLSRQHRRAGTTSAAAVDAAVVAIDATTVVAHDVSPPPPADAGTPLVAVIDAGDADVGVRAKVITDAAIAAPPAASPPTLAQLYAAGHYVELADRCATEHAVSADVAAVCAVAACKLHRDADAQRYFGAIPAARQGRVIALCPELAVPPTPPPPNKPDCKADPMACSH
jgi:serine/threonine protein kinase